MSTPTTQISLAAAGQPPLAGPSASRSLGGALKFLVLALLLASCVLGLGCRRKTPPEARPSEVPAPPSAESGPSAPPVARAPITHAELAALNQGVAMYGMETMGGKRTKLPTSVEQLVKEGFLSHMPVAPPGKKLIINPRTGLIEMVNQ